MERNVEVATGESVVFSYELAGLGSRFLAVAVDLLLQLAVATSVLVAFAWTASAQRGTALANVTHAVLVALVAILIFCVFFGYFIFFEWRYAGRTPGKRALGIRVVRDGGFPIDFTSAVVRNVVRILEVALGFYAVSAFCALLSPSNRRLGDMAAGTLVVREQRYESVAALSRAPEFDRPGSAVLGLTADERDLIRRYVARRATFKLYARSDVAALIAARVRPKLTARFEHLDDDDLLVHLAATALQ